MVITQLWVTKTFEYKKFIGVAINGRPHLAQKVLYYYSNDEFIWYQNPVTHISFIMNIA